VNGYDFSTTLILVIHKILDDGHHFVASYWVGDGGTGIFRKGDKVLPLGKADSGEFAGQTRFLDGSMLEPEELKKRINFAVANDFTAVVAMTDGITDPKFETDANFEKLEKWDQLWAELEPILYSDHPAGELLNWLDFWSVGNHDDRTIAILYPNKPEAVKQ
jgi:hypothetical protein